MGVGWRDVSKSSEDSLVRKKKKVSRPRIFLVLFLFFSPSGQRWQLIRHNSWQSPAGVRIKMTLSSTSRSGKGRRSVYGRGEDEGNKVTNAAASAGYSTSTRRG